METRVRPKFIDEISDSNYFRRKNVVLLTGNVNDIFYNDANDNFLSLEQELFAELKDKFTVVRIDMSLGLSFFDSVFEAEFSSETEKELDMVCRGLNFPYFKTGGLKSQFQQNRHNPLVTLVLLKQVSDLFRQAQRMKLEKVKPLCIVIQHTGSLFPAGSLNQLSELDRQRLIFFLSWISDPAFQDGSELIVLINRVKAEVNGEITALPNVAHIEVPLPEEEERRKFIQKSITKESGITFERGEIKFVSDTAGLTLNSLKDLIEIASITKKEVTQADVLAEVNLVIRSALGDIVKVKRPTHKPDDIIGYKATGGIIADIFERCEDPELAVSAILVSGPNGGGKTYQLEAYASQSGRVVIELTGLRDSLFGGTDKLFEQLRMYLVTLGKVLILVDEAHTAFGSVHSKDTHETEKRLAGNMIKLMGDPNLRGKILWALMTSRPDELDPDVKSRAPIQIPIFDLEGDERRQFVAEMLRRKKIDFADSELDIIIKQTDYYSARDYDNFVREIRSQQKKDSSVRSHEVLSRWQASRSIAKNRKFQTLVAAQHCSYPELLPVALRDKEEEIPGMIEEMRLRMY
ncbi:MAG: AAA family ATPase [Candidatus Taylorbacteria bacterium]|nr:AAA family ATPase [Candidatus Taylorbacteria bacterium]